MNNPVISYRLSAKTAKSNISLLLLMPSPSPPEWMPADYPDAIIAKDILAAIQLADDLQLHSAAVRNNIHQPILAEQGNNPDPVTPEAYILPNSLDTLFAIGWKQDKRLLAHIGFLNALRQFHYSYYISQMV
jgi:hypothetical protein